MKLSQEQIDSILQSSLPDVVKSVEVEMKELVINQIRYSSSEVISNYIKEWVTENIIKFKCGHERALPLDETGEALKEKIALLEKHECQTCAAMALSVAAGRGIVLVRKARTR